jgi:hypothetical protein
MRVVFSIIVGVLVAFFLTGLIEGVGGWLYPVSGDIVSADRATLAALMAGMPFPAKLIVAAGWLIAPFIGVWLCLRIGDRPIGGWIVTAAFLVASVANQIVLPHPLWMQICSVALPIFGSWAAQRLHYTPYPGEPLLG